MTYDVIVAGAGPGGSSAAAFLAREGLSVLLLDKAEFPRDKVCGDGLAPQAIYWLDVLGCAGEVLDQTNSCVTSSDLFVNGEYVLTGRFPQDTRYPGFGTCLERTKLDHLLVKHAIARGAVFKPRHHVKRLIPLDNGIRVETVFKGTTVGFLGRLLIGADGAGSLVSRHIGNRTKGNTVALSLRCYYEGVTPEMSPFKLFLSERFYPGYGWIFVDDGGKANVGFGYVAGREFPMKRPVRDLFDEFVRSDLHVVLGKATAVGPPAGWWEPLLKPRSMVADRIMLVGDAGCCADPMNGAGIHRAIESAYLASNVAVQALCRGDCSREMLSRYQRAWIETNGPDSQVGELFISILKNPHFRELYFFLLKKLGDLSGEDQRFQDFCCGLFSGVIPQRSCLSPQRLSAALPRDLSAWSSLVRGTGGTGAPATASSLVRNALTIAGRMASAPVANIGWGMEVTAKVLGIIGERARKRTPSPVGTTALRA